MANSMTAPSRIRLEQKIAKAQEKLRRDDILKMMIKCSKPITRGLAEAIASYDELYDVMIDERFTGDVIGKALSELMTDENARNLFCSSCLTQMEK